MLRSTNVKILGTFPIQVPIRERQIEQTVKNEIDENLYFWRYGKMSFRHTLVWRLDLDPTFRKVCQNPDFFQILVTMNDGSPFISAFCSCIEKSFKQKSFINIFQHIQQVPPFHTLFTSLRHSSNDGIDVYVTLSIVNKLWCDVTSNTTKQHSLYRTANARVKMNTYTLLRFKDSMYWNIALRYNVPLQ